MNLILLGAPHVSRRAHQTIGGVFAGSLIEIKKYMIPVSLI
jgi:hypothetical protein